MSTRSPLLHDGPRPVARADIPTLIVRWHEERDGRARDLVFDRFAPLARRLAHRYHTPHEPIEDLVQVAYLGLLGAIERFDPHRGPPFAGFAIPTILGELKKHFRNTGWALHVSRGQQEMSLRIERAVARIMAETGRHPRIAQLAEYLEVSTEEILEGLDAGTAHYAMSLDAPVTAAEPDDPDSLMDTVGRTDDGFGLVEATSSLTTAIARLPYCERQVVTLRLRRDLKQSEIAAELGCSQMQVSRLLRRAAERIREMTALPSA